MPNVLVIDDNCWIGAPGTVEVMVPPPAVGVVMLTSLPGTSCAPLPSTLLNDPPRELRKPLTPISLPALRFTSAKRTSTITCWLEPTLSRLMTLSPA